MADPTCVLDASALLAYLAGEDGADVVERAIIEGAAISAVNLAEILAKITDRGGDPEGARNNVSNIVEVVSFDEVQAVESARLRPVTRPYDVSLGDRACLALGRVLNVPVVTADTQWESIPRLRVRVRAIR